MRKRPRSPIEEIASMSPQTSVLTPVVRSPHILISDHGNSVSGHSMSASPPSSILNSDSKCNGMFCVGFSITVTEVIRQFDLYSSKLNSKTSPVDFFLRNGEYSFSFLPNHSVKIEAIGINDFSQARSKIENFLKRCCENHKKFNTGFDQLFKPECVRLHDVSALEYRFPDEVLKLCSGAENMTTLQFLVLHLDHDDPVKLCNEIKRLFKHSDIFQSHRSLPPINTVLTQPSVHHTPLIFSATTPASTVPINPFPTLGPQQLTTPSGLTIGYCKQIGNFSFTLLPNHFIKIQYIHEPNNTHKKFKDFLRGLYRRHIFVNADLADLFKNECVSKEQGEVRYKVPDEFLKRCSPGEEDKVALTLFEKCEVIFGRKKEDILLSTINEIRSLFNKPALLKLKKTSPSQVAKTTPLSPSHTKTTLNKTSGLTKNRTAFFFSQESSEDSSSLDDFSNEFQPIINSTTNSALDGNDNSFFPEPLPEPLSPLLQLYGEPCPSSFLPVSIPNAPLSSTENQPPSSWEEEDPLLFGPT